MTEYLYRVVYRLKQPYWKAKEDSEWKTYCSSTNPSGRPYRNARAVKGIVSGYSGQMKLEFKAQCFPLTQEWEDLDE